MPVYDYKCDTCGHRFERRQSFSDDPIRVCPDCGGVTRRVIHAPGVVFKGSGFYKTDSRSEPATKSDGATEKSDETTTEKPAEKATEAPASTEKAAEKPVEKLAAPAAPAAKPADPAA